MKPPRALRWALRLLLDREDRREVESDLEELYELRRQRDGERAARAWLARQWAQYPPRLLLAASRRPAEPRPGGPRPHPDRSRLERGEPMENLWTDLRLSLRSLSRSPGLALTIVLTVGLGIGATTTLGSLVHTVLLKPLPYPEPGRLVRIYTDSPPHRFPFSVADYLALAEQQTRFEAVAGYTNTSQAFTRDDVAERISGKLVTGGYFSLLGVRPAAGRLLGPEDDRPGAEPVVVVSGRFARRYLGGAEAAVGQAVRLNGTDYRVAGVLPARVGPFEQDRDFFAPARWQTPPRKGPFFITALGRLRSEGDREAAAAELRAINQRIFPLWRTSYQDDKASWAALDLKESVIGDVATRLLLVLGAVAFVLLIASTNASNLLLARAAQRRRELALRDALGASRGRLVQLQLAESALLSLGAAALGLAFAAGGGWLAVHAGAGYLPRAHEIALSPPVLAFWAALTLGSAALFGLVPALAGARSRRGGALGAGGRSSTGGPATRRLRQALVAAQFAVATPLLIGSGLLLASPRQLEQVDPGL
ncbi:MAG: ABC transporter permease [Thermoanaerobaculia bacterium]